MKKILMLMIVSVFLISLVSAVTNITTCQDLNVSSETYNLLNNVTANGTCFNVEADSVTLDCQGNYIILDNTGEIGVDYDGFDNIILQNCNLYSITPSVYGMRGGDTLASGGTYNNPSMTFQDGSVFFNATSGTSIAFYQDRGSGYYTIQDSNIVVNYGYVFYGDSNGGTTRRLRMYRNNISFGQNQAIKLYDNEWSQNEYINNSIIATNDNLIAIDGSQSGQCINADDMIIGNYIYSATSYKACSNDETTKSNIGYMEDNIFDGTPSTSSLPLISADASTNYGYVRYSFDNNTFINPSGSWIFNHRVRVGVDLMTNTTFITPYGEVLIPSFDFNASDSQLTQSDLNISNDSIFTDLTNYPNLNVSMQMTINNPKLPTNNFPFGDKYNNGTFTFCDYCVILDDTTPFIFEGSGFYEYQSWSDFPTPSIDFTVGTEDDDEIVYERNYIFVNVTSDVVYEGSITFYLFDSEDSLILNNTYTDGTRDIIWTSISNGVYKYNVSIINAFGNSNQTETRTITVYNEPNDYLPLFTGEITYEGERREIYQVMRESGAGLGKFLLYMADSLPLLLVFFGILSVILIIGYGVAEAIKHYFTQKKE